MAIYSWESKSLVRFSISTFSDLFTYSPFSLSRKEVFTFPLKVIEIFSMSLSYLK